MAEQETMNSWYDLIYEELTVIRARFDVRERKRPTPSEAAARDEMYRAAAKEAAKALRSLGSCLAVAAAFAETLRRCRTGEFDYFAPPIIDCDRQLDMTTAMTVGPYR